MRLQATPLTLWSFFSIVVCGLGQVPTHRYLISEIQVSGSDDGRRVTSLAKLNNDGIVVGRIDGPEGSNGFFYRQGATVEVNRGGPTELTDVNDAGQAVGNFDDQGVRRAFLWSTGSGTAINTNLNFFAEHTRIDGSNRAYGLVTTSSPPYLATYLSGARTNFPATENAAPPFFVSPQGDITGRIPTPNGSGVFRYSNGNLQNLTSGTCSDINERGDVLLYRPSRGRSSVYRKDGGIVELLPNGKVWTSFNNYGELLGYRDGRIEVGWQGEPKDVLNHASSNWLFESLSPGQDAHLINDWGQLVVFGNYAEVGPDGQRAFLISKNIPQGPVNDDYLDYVDWGFVNASKLTSNTDFIGANTGSAVRLRDGLNNTGTLAARNQGVLILGGSLANHDTVRLDGGSLVTEGPLVLSGGGEVLLLNGGFLTNIHSSSQQPARIGTEQGKLVNLDNTISGSGAILGMRVDNRDEIVAGGGESLRVYLNPPSSNSGVMKAEYGGLLSLAGGSQVPLDNSGGTLAAIGRGNSAELGPNAPAVLQLAGCPLEDTTVRAVSGGLIQVVNQAGESDYPLDDVDVLLQGAGSSIHFGDDDVDALSGTIRDVRVIGDGSPGQRVRFAANSIYDVIYPTFEDVGFEGGMPLTVTSFNQVGLIGDFTNDGIFRIGDPGHYQGGGSNKLLIKGRVVLRGDGELVLSKGTPLPDEENYPNCIDGDTRNDPETRDILFNVTTIRGSGIIGASYQGGEGPYCHMSIHNSLTGTIGAASGDELELHATLGDPVRNEGHLVVSRGGTMSVQGDLSMEVGSSLSLQLGGVEPVAGYSALEVTGAVDLEVDLPILDLQFEAGFNPPPGTVFTLLKAGSLQGEFLHYGDRLKFWEGSTRYRFDYHGGDGNDVTLTSIVANRPPLAVADAAVALDNTTVIGIAVLANDSDPDEDYLTITAVTQGSHGSVAIDGATVNYTPGPGFSGTDQFTYAIDDGYGGTATGVVTIEGYAETIVEWYTGYSIIYGVPSICGDLDDPNGNGIPNLLEYALGGDPMAPGLPPLPQVGVEDGFATFSFRRMLARTELTYKVQATSTPEIADSWVDLASSIHGAATLPRVPGVSVSETGSGLSRTVVVKDIVPADTVPGRFFRLMVTR